MIPWDSMRKTFWKSPDTKGKKKKAMGDYFCSNLEVTYIQISVTYSLNINASSSQQGLIKPCMKVNMEDVIASWKKYSDSCTVGTTYSQICPSLTKRSSANTENRVVFDFTQMKCWPEKWDVKVNFPYLPNRFINNTCKHWEKGKG